MIFEHRERRPLVDPGAWVAPTAVLSGEVTIGPGSAVLHGAIVNAESGPVVIGRECVVMENAVLRGTRRHPLRIGDGVLIGPAAHVTGCEILDGAFIATGAAVFNGARVGREATVRVHGVVHVNSQLGDGEVVPIHWVAVGRPAEVFPPDDHGRIWAIQEKLDFPGTVFGVERSKAPSGIRRYARALVRHGDGRRLEPGDTRATGPTRDDE